MIDLTFIYMWLMDFFRDPFNKQALAHALTLIATLTQENLRLQALVRTLEGPDIREKQPEPLVPFRVRLSRRDLRAKKEAELNKTYRSIQQLNEALERGAFDNVHN